MTPSLRADYRECGAIIARGSRSFYAASLLLPAKLRKHAFALYAFCRVSDDAVDEAGAEASALMHLRDRLMRIYAGRPLAAPVDRALADTVRRFAVPKSAFQALFEGYQWDLEGRRYRRLEDVLEYAARVAGSVGIMMSCLMGARSPILLARACDLGVAMQLTNIARDVGEDARAGRFYLPSAWLESTGFNQESWLLHPTPHVVIKRATVRLLDEADRLYARADAGIAHLPANCRAAIRAASLIYAEIGASIRAAGGDSVSRRLSTTMARKSALVVRALSNRLRYQQVDLEAAPLPATAFLVAGIAGQPAPTFQAPAKGLLERIDESWGRVFDLFQALEHRRFLGSSFE